MYSHIRVFGCACYPHLGPYRKEKLQPKSTKCVFLGYSTIHKGYRCFDPSASRLYISRHVIFDEHCFPFQKQVDSPTSPISTTVTSIVPMPLMLPISSSSSAPTTDSSVDLSSEPSLSSPSDSSAGNHTSPASANSPVDQPPVSTHSLVGSPSVQT